MPSWTDEEIAILTEKYPKQGCNIPELLPRGKHSIKLKANNLTIRKNGGRYDAWSNNELTILKEQYSKKGTNIPELLERRTIHAIKTKAKKLGIRYNGPHKHGLINQFGTFIPWSNEEITILREKYPENGSNIAELFLRDTYSINRKANSLGLKSDRRKWFKEEINFLIEKYPEQGTVIPEILNRHSKKAITHKAREFRIETDKIGTGRKWSKEEIKILIEKYPRQGTNIPELMKKHTRLGIQGTAIKLGVNWNGFRKKIELSEETKELIDGLILGDGGFAKGTASALLAITQVIDRKEWLEDIEKRLNKVGIETSGVKPKRKIETTTIINGIKTRQKRNCALYTLSYTTFLDEMTKWGYFNAETRGKDTIPEDTSTSPLTLALWYMGDGTLGNERDKKNKKKTIWYRIRIATDCFLFGLNEFKEKLEERYGWRIIIDSRNRIQLNYQKDVLEFLTITESYKVSCFEYKWRALNDKIWLNKHRIRQSK